MDRAARRRAQREQAKPAAALAYISGGHTVHGFTDSMLGSLLYDAREGENRICSYLGGTISLQSSPRIVSSRTQCVTAFLKLEDRDPDEWLVMIDADMTWDDDTIHNMLDRAEANDHQIVGGLCFAGGRSESMYPTVYQVTGTRDDGLPIVDRVALIDPEMVMAIDSDDPPMLKVDGTGAAFLAVRRRVLQDMVDAFGVMADGRINPHPFFAEMVGDGVEYGEDLMFCLRARQLGYEIWLDTAAKIGHVKTYELNWDLYKDMVVDPPAMRIAQLEEELARARASKPKVDLPSL